MKIFTMLFLAVFAISGIVAAQTLKGTVQAQVLQCQNNTNSDNNLIAQLQARISQLQGDLVSQANCINSYNALVPYAQNEDTVIANQANQANMQVNGV